MPVTLIDTIRLLARYNRLANERLYDTCATVGDGERKKIRPAFFDSIHGTLNHIMVGDRVWLARFEGVSAPSTNLDAILYDDFAAMRAARRVEDARIEAFAAMVDDAFLAGTIRYKNNEGRNFEDPTAMLTIHFFNHQTHHRGQVHDMLTQTDVEPPVLDLHRVLKPDPDSLDPTSLLSS
jgi:uncharacterized damage-inducible protein DinB